MAPAVLDKSRSTLVRMRKQRNLSSGRKVPSMFQCSARPPNLADVGVKIVRVFSMCVDVVVCGELYKIHLFLMKGKSYNSKTLYADTVISVTEGLCCCDYIYMELFRKILLTEIF